MEQTQADIHESMKLVYPSTIKMMNDVEKREPTRHFPVGAMDGYGPSPGITNMKFDVTTDETVDTRTAMLSFQLSLLTAAGAAAPAARINKATDVVRKIVIRYADQEVEQIDNCNAFASLFTNQLCNRTWFAAEGSALLGITNHIQFSDAGTRTGIETYCVPLCLLSGFCRMDHLLPMLGQKLTIEITLAPNEEVINLSDTAATNYYQMNKVSLLMDTVILKKAKKEELYGKMMSGDIANVIPYTTLQTSTQSVTASAFQVFKIQHNLADAKSLHMLLDHPTAKGVAYAASVTNWTLHRDSFAMPTFQKLEVSVPGRPFTPQPNGIQSYQELYSAAEKCHHNFMSIGGDGFINNSIMKASYMPGTNPTLNTATGGYYGYCPMSISLSTDVSDDNQVVGTGANAARGFGSLDVQLTTSAALLATDVILYALVHTRLLTIMNSHAKVVA